MKTKIKILVLLIITLLFGIRISFSQDPVSPKYKKSITVGVSTVITKPFFLNALPDIGFRMYNRKANIGFGINTQLLVRFKLDNFIVSLTDIKAYKKVHPDGKFPIDIGLGIGWGINSVPEWKFLLTSAYIAIPIWKFHLECQPTLVIPNYNSSFLNLSIAYYFTFK